MPKKNERSVDGYLLPHTMFQTLSTNIYTINYLAVDTSSIPVIIKTCTNVSASAVNGSMTHLNLVE